MRWIKDEGIEAREGEKRKVATMEDEGPHSHAGRAEPRRVTQDHAASRRTSQRIAQARKQSVIMSTA